MTRLVAALREHCEDRVDIVLVIGAAERQVFEPLAAEHSCRLVYIEDLIFDYTGRRVDAARLLAIIDRFRYQALKKLLGMASLTGNVFVMDSETVVTRDLTPIFEGGIADTTVAYTERPWGTMKPQLTSEVYTECCELLGDQPYWFFESFNWLYSSDLVRDLLRYLWDTFGQDWVFRARPMFECQLYFHYAHTRGSDYRFIPARDILAIHFPGDQPDRILKGVFSSPLEGFGVFEYLARFVTRDEYLSFVANPEILRHFRLMRHEPYGFWDIVGAVRRAAAHDPNYFGEASMHRRPLLSGRIAVIVSGRFHHEEDAQNVRQFLREVDCDVFLGIGASHWTDAAVMEIVQPCRIGRVDDEAVLQSRTEALRNATGIPERYTKPARNLGSMAMFDKLAAGWHALLEEEAARGERYAVVVRTRPDIVSLRGLRDILWKVAEKMGSLEGFIMVPDSFWSQGINDQLFLGLREEMGRLLTGVNGDAYAACEFLNPEYFLGKHLRAAGLSPAPFPFEYILTRGKQPKLGKVEQNLAAQRHHFWSATQNLPAWKNAGAALDEALANVLAKNAHLKPATVINRRGVDADLLMGHDEHGSAYALVSEHKSPRVYLFRVPPFASSTAAHSIAAGLVTPSLGEAVKIESFDVTTGKVELSTTAVPRAYGKHHKIAPLPLQRKISLRLTPPPPSLIFGLARRSVRTSRAAFAGLKAFAVVMRRNARDLRAQWRFSKL